VRYEGAVRIGELSRDTGVPVPTIKYYLREGLLPAGERTHANQVVYDARHARRLRLIRAMVGLGDLPVGTVRDLPAALDAPGVDTDSLLGRLSTALRRPRDDAPAEGEGLAAARELFDRHGYVADEAHVHAVADVLAALRQFGDTDLSGIADAYADAALAVAETDLAAIGGLPDREATAEAMIVGTVLGDALLIALRRAAHATVSRRVYPK
jgi:DNA-binding transcriptional MerR regulator